MADHSKHKDNNSPITDRLLQSLVEYLRRRNYERASYPHDDKVLQSKTLLQINKAFDIIEAPNISKLEKYYSKLMDGRDDYTTTPGIAVMSLEWKPIDEIRFEPIKCTHILSGSTMLIFTPVDVFSVMWCRIELPRTVRIFYGIQSLLAREQAKYYLAYTANPQARTPSWRLRSLGGHEIGKGLPIVLGTNSSFSGRNRAVFEALNPLPQLQPIPIIEASLHDFIVQIVTGNARAGANGSIGFSGRQFGDVNLTDIPAATQDTRQGGVRANLNETLLERQARAERARAVAARVATPVMDDLGRRLEAMAQTPPVRPRGRTRVTNDDEIAW